MIPGAQVRPGPTLETSERACYRCGAYWKDSRGEFVPGAPCRDCRDVLVLEGHARSEWLRPDRAPRKEYPRRKVAA